MAIKTFTTGEVLTAADTNTYLANSGLVYVASGTVAANTALNFTSLITASFLRHQQDKQRHKTP